MRSRCSLRGRGRRGGRFPSQWGVRRGRRAELGSVVKGRASGAQQVWQRRPVGAALGATASQRTMYGILLLTSILLYRNYFYAASGANVSLAHFTLVVIASAVGYGAAAVATPIVTRRLSKAMWIAVMLGLGGLITAVLGPTFRQPSFLIIGLTLGLVAQGVAICTTTIIQQRMDDNYRGRVFALYDMLFNVPFVLGAVVAAQIIPDNGKSYAMIAVAAIGYLAAAGLYAVVSRQELRPGRGPGPAPSAPPGSPAPPESAELLDPESLDFSESLEPPEAPDGPPGPGAPPGTESPPSTAHRRNS